MTGSIDDLIHYRINRAFETLREAETMIENEFWNASINRIYYACFYAVSGLLLKKGLIPPPIKGYARCLVCILSKRELYQKN